MNRIVLAIAAYVALALEIGFKPALALGESAVAPSFVAPLAAFCALLAPANRVVWICMGLGLLVDLTAHTGGAGVAGVGPNALGFALGGALVKSLRGVLIRRNPLTIMLMAVCLMVLASLVVVACYTLRSLLGYDDAWNAGGELIARMSSAMYTAVSGLVMGWVLSPMAALFGWGETRYGAHFAARR